MGESAGTGMPQRPPSVDSLARSLAGTGLPHPLLVDLAREAIHSDRLGDLDRLVGEYQGRLLGEVINATGVLLHTNLGRAPYGTSHEARYSNLELDLESGQRGSRQDHAGWLVARAAGAEHAMVVNNGAAAVLLVLAALARGRGVAVSRGELVQLGGGFRLPEVIEEAGVELVEVGTTNRTTLTDYRHAVEDPDRPVAVVLKVHQSNFQIVGFTASTRVAEFSSIGVPVVVDLGSGLLDAGTPWLPGGPPAWLAHEPAVRQTLTAGADVVTFSGDKLLGGPQAGIIAGRRDLVERCAQHPLYRALRPGDTILASLQQLALGYLDGTAGEHPLWRMIAVPVDELRHRADQLLTQVSVSGAASGATIAVPGGGSVPGAEIPSWGLHLEGDHTEGLRTTGPTPVIGRVQDGTTILDLRSVFPDQDDDLASVLREL
jgi:L-seryl-tRNA(Ser) seleniumtransferase